MFKALTSNLQAFTAELVLVTTRDRSWVVKKRAMTTKAWKGAKNCTHGPWWGNVCCFDLTPRTQYKSSYLSIILHTYWPWLSLTICISLWHLELQPSLFAVPSMHTVCMCKFFESFSGAVSMDDIFDNLCLSGCLWFFDYIFLFVLFSLGIIVF